MSGRRVTAIPFRGLSDCFNPPGIPLVEKAPGIATTSVLVRGRAGTGKSTLALAVAHAIAEVSGGIVLYLVTEASFSDVEFKAEVVGLASQVVSLDAALNGNQGKVAVCHLVLEHPESADLESTEELSKDALAFALSLLERHQSLGIRALVIDSLLVPEGGQAADKRLGRMALVGYLQSIEALGVSPVLVEETQAQSSEQMTFPVDLVFELSLASNPDTGGLVRQLVVSKCRYSDCSPGPHDAVLEDCAPAVWPFAPSFDFRVEKPLGFFMPVPGTNNRTRVLAINRSALILSPYDIEQQSVLRAWSHSPGLCQVVVQCGPFTTITGPDGRLRTIPTSHGPLALQWIVQEIVQSTKANAVLFVQLEHLLAKPRFSLALPELLSRLTRRGITILVHGTSSGLAAVYDLAAFAGPKGHYIVNDVTTPLPRDFRCASAWRSFLPGIDRPERRPGTPNTASLVAALREADEKIENREFQTAGDILKSINSGANDPLSLRLQIEVAWSLHRIGMTRTALQRVQKAKSDDPAALAALGWVLVEMGDYENACRVALEAIDRDEVHAESVRLWRALRGRFTLVDQQAELSPLSLCLWLEAAAIHGSWEVSESWLAQVAKAEGLAGEVLERLQADARMASPSSEKWLDAKGRYEALLTQQVLSPLDRADILFNLGVIHDRVGERDRAIEQLQKALEVNPLHEPAQDRLESFGVVASLVG